MEQNTIVITMFLTMLALLVGGYLLAWFTREAFVRKLALGTFALITILFGVLGILWVIGIPKGAGISFKVVCGVFPFLLLLNGLRFAWLAVRGQPAQPPQS